MKRLAALALATALLALPGQALAADPLLRSQQWNLDMVEADAAHATSTGRGAVVAVIDSGVNLSHPDLAGRLLAGRDFVDGDSTPQDGDGHGTHIAGIVAASSGNGEGVESVAPDAQILPLRVLDDNGEGFTEDVVAAVDYAVAQGADVINLSLSSTLPLLGDLLDPTFGRAIDRALDRGVIVVAVAGNSSLPICESPSGQGRLLCVGAVDRRRQRSAYSSFGLGLGLMAPGGSAAPAEGENILSTYTSPLYEEVAGTSQASPHVAGVAALLVSRGVHGQAAVRRILATASDSGSPGPDIVYGAGIVNARRAVAGLPRDAGEIRPEPPSQDPSASPRSGGSAVRISVPRRQRLRAVLRRGILVRCRAAGAGRCTVSATRRGRRVARGSKRLRAGRTTSFRVRIRRGSRRSLRRGTRLRLTIRAPGAGPVRRTVILR
ncbi:MAG: S8 family serine peptidase [Thermoleophilaceae bacterium]